MMKRLLLLCGLALTFAALTFPVRAEETIPPEENAATYYNKAFELMRDWASNDVMMRARKIIKEGWKEEDKKLEELLKANEPAFSEFREGVAKEKCQFIEGEITFDTLLPHLAKARNLSRLLILEARHYERNGYLDKAIGNCLDVMKLGYDLDCERIMITTLLGVAIRGISRSTFGDLIASENLTPQMGKKALKRLIELERNAVPPAYIIRGELAYAKSGLEKALSCVPQQAKEEDVGDTCEELSHKTLLLLDKHLKQMAADLEKAGYQHMKAGLEQVIEELEQTERALRKGTEPIIPVEAIPKLLVLQRLRPLQETAKAMLRAQASQRLLIALLAVKLFKMEKGRFPKSLDELVPQYLAEVPLDPFDLKPLRYKKRQGKWIIYSIGPDGKDDGGVKNYVHRQAEEGADLIYEVEPVK